jgi:voltage-gated potassium channel
MEITKTKKIPNKKTILHFIIAVSTIASLILVFVDFIFPLTETQRISLRLFDFIVVVILAVDFYARIRNSEDKLKYILIHLYEFPAMMPLLLTGTGDASSVLYYVRFIALFRLVRLYNIMSLLEGSELIMLAGLSVISIIFGAFGFYLAEVGKPDSTITSLYDALWWSVETITTVAYGEYYPVTATGRIIATVMMFAAIGFLWTFVGLLSSVLVSRRLKKSQSTTTTVVNDTKTLIKNRIDGVENLSDEDLEDLITVIRSLNSRKKRKSEP